MVAAGGFAASGVQAHANSYSVPSIERLVDKLKSYDKSIYHEVKGYAEEHGGIIAAVYDNERDMFNDIKKRFKGNNELVERLRVPVGCGWGPSSSIKFEFKYRRENNIINVSYYGVYFLVIFDK